MLVDDVTMRATRSSVAYADAGERLLKGFSGPARPTRARSPWRSPRRRCVGGVVRRALSRAEHGQGALPAPPRRRVAHGSSRSPEWRASRESRLAWEFELYVEGLVDEVFWHRGRCPSYGDGVAFWALAEMIRARFDIEEDDVAEAAAAKLAGGLPRWVPDSSEREFV